MELKQNKKKKKTPSKVHMGHLQRDVQTNVLKKHPNLHKPLCNIAKNLEA